MSLGPMRPGKWYDVPGLGNATAVQRERFTISGGGTGIHWDDLDEDISVPALLLGIGDRTRKPRP